MFKRFITLFICIAFCCFQANAQGWFPLAMSSGGGGGGFSITFTDTKTDTGGVNNPITFNGGGNPNIGTSNTNRNIGLCFLWRASSGGITSVNVNGNAATHITNSGSTSTPASMFTDMWTITEAAAGTSGLTTASVQATFNTTPLRAGVFVYDIVTTTPTPTTAQNGSGNTTNTLTLSSITVPSGGGSIACSAFRTVAAATWSGPTSSADVDTTIAATHEITATHSLATGSQSYTITYASGSSDVEASVAAWGP